MHGLATRCDVARAAELVYAIGLDLETAMVGIGLSRRLCDRLDCRSRARTPLEHCRALHPLVEGTAPWRCAVKPRR